MTKHSLTNAQILAQERAATKHEKKDRDAGLRASSVWYDHASGYLMMVLTNDRLFGVPARAIPHLKGLPPAQLGRVTLSPSGGGLHWDDLDLHLDVPGLLLDALGRSELAREWARAAGRVKTPARAKASRANGVKGGRPRKHTAA